VYNVDGDVTEVHVSGQPTWRYEYDTDGNIVKANHHGNVRSFSIDAPLGGRLDSASEQSYVHDADGRVVQRDRETFEYDAFGGLTRAFEQGRYDVTFHYDAFHRLTVKRDVITGDIVQYFYADVSRKDRITHIVETGGQPVGGSGGVGGSRGGSNANVSGGNRRRMTELFYDSRGKLFAMRRDNNIHYVALDPTDSPVVILNSVGSVVKQVEYDPLGATLTDSAPDHVFPLGFRCGVIDLATRLVLLADGRAYDSSIGRWMVPDYDRLVDGIERLAATPESSNLYSATSFLWKNDETNGGFTTGRWRCVAILYLFMPRAYFQDQNFVILPETAPPSVEKLTQHCL
jgi:YD repeat-containing protein